MTPRQKIDELKREMDSLERAIQNCHHKFNDAIYDPSTVKEEYATEEYENHGVDHWPITAFRDKTKQLTAFRDKTKQRWSRECSICGKKEYTYKQEPVISTYKPKFR